ncbi:Rv3235 family protein [Saccharopolyspora rosea]|uniref:Rv3235 family protein n=1 Tax=Saccharopolyspora rosea TaxID=524884 RepID=A0ABW3G0J6_9PSEU|nr:Rv3235 family protein [Saccharopolyspora rosea]
MTTATPLTGAEAPTPAERSATALAARVGEQLLDVLAGRRPLSQVRDRVSGPVAFRLAGTRLHAARSPGYRLRSVHACLTAESTVEACLVVGSPCRARALVLRLERDGTRWVCTLLSLV